MVRGKRRSGFTLVELMVVILIIAILVTLLSSAIVTVLGRVPEVQTRTDISQLAVALQAFMNDYQLSDPPPSLLILKEDLSYNMSNPLEARSYTFLKRIFGRNLGTSIVNGVPTLTPVDWNGDGIQNGPWTLEGECCLIWYIGGTPNVQAMKSGSPPQPLGFSLNNMHPETLPASGEKRHGPYFDFNNTRLVASVGGFFKYLDGWMMKTGPSPYVYYSSYGLMNGYGLIDCNSVDTAGPYWTAQNALGVPTQFTNPNGYQIISAGKDGKFGGGLWSPNDGATGFGADDQANFSSTLLGKGQN